MKIYLDNSAWNRPFDDQSVARNVMEANVTQQQVQGFDYMKWRSQFFKDETVDELLDLST